MARLHFAIFAALASFLLAACDEPTREYPRGYTDDGIKFEENGWRYFPGTKQITLVYFGEISRPQLSISCDLERSRSDSPVARIVGSQMLRVSTSLLTPLSQWPQPELMVKVGPIAVGGLNEIFILDAGSATLKAHFVKREKDQLIGAISRGAPITLGFGDQSLEFPGVPQSMRQGFARNCRQDR